MIYRNMAGRKCEILIICLRGADCDLYTEFIFFNALEQALWRNVLVPEEP